jgi:hypothetical protein
MGLMIRGLSPERGWEFISSPPCPDRLRDPPSLLSNGYQGLFPWGGKAAGAWSWPLTSIQCRGQQCVELYLHSPITPSRHGAQLKRKAWGQLYLYLLPYSIHQINMSQQHVTYFQQMTLVTNDWWFHCLYWYYKNSLSSYCACSIYNCNFKE